jgi:hypothetical protein
VRTTPVRLTVIAVVALGAVALSGCGETRIDVSKGERMILAAVREQVRAEVKSVECPKGLIAKKGETFRCRVTGTDGTFGDAIVTERDDRGSVSVDAPFLHVRDVETSVAEGIADDIGGGRVRVRCPEIVTVEAGGTFRCRARSGGDVARVRVVQQDDQGRVRYEVVQ